MSIVSRTALLPLLAAVTLAGLSGCATETSTAVAVQQVESVNRPYSGPRSPIAVGKFDNRSSYMRGIFSDGVDRLGGQAKTILITHLQQTNRFSVLDRDNMSEIQQEAAIKGQAQRLKGPISWSPATSPSSVARKWATTSCSASSVAARPRSPTPRWR